MTSTCDFGDIFVCRFPFTSGESSKPRPVLVLFDLGQDAVICRITSVQYSSHLDIPILRWQEAGLEKPSVARLNRLVTAEKSLLNRLLGKLSEPDLAAIRAAWNRHMVL
jgi:mRNA interferase MazF